MPTDRLQEEKSLESARVGDGWMIRPRNKGRMKGKAQLRARRSTTSQAKTKKKPLQ